MIKNFHLIVLFLLLLIVPARSEYWVVFCPKGDATGKCVAEIDAAKKQILIDAYGFTSVPIGAALQAAVKRGVEVKCVLDKSNLTSKKSLALVLMKDGVPVWIDFHPPISHEKAFIIDATLSRRRVMFGSFNPTGQGQKNNEDWQCFWNTPGFVEAYVGNWKLRQSLSVPWAQYAKMKGVAK
ncbi:MAG: phospholipase D-like domain-containing protein [Chthoniobacterales bacterium]